MCLSNLLSGEFPGGPVVRTPRFHCRGAGFDSLVRELRSRRPCSMAKIKNNNLLSGFFELA